MAATGTQTWSQCIATGAARSGLKQITSCSCGLVSNSSFSWTLQGSSKNDDDDLQFCNTSAHVVTCTFTEGSASGGNKCGGVTCNDVLCPSGNWTGNIDLNLVCNKTTPSVPECVYNQFYQDSNNNTGSINGYNIGVYQGWQAILRSGGYNLFFFSICFFWFLFQRWRNSRRWWAGKSSAIGLKNRRRMCMPKPNHFFAGVFKFFTMSQESVYQICGAEHGGAEAVAYLDLIAYLGGFLAILLFAEIPLLMIHTTNSAKEATKVGGIAVGDFAYYTGQAMGQCSYIDAYASGLDSAALTDDAQCRDMWWHVVYMYMTSGYILAFYWFLSKRLWIDRNFLCCKSCDMRSVPGVRRVVQCPRRHNQPRTLLAWRTVFITQQNTHDGAQSCLICMKQCIGQEEQREPSPLMDMEVKAEEVMSHKMVGHEKDIRTMLQEIMDRVGMNEKSKISDLTLVWDLHDISYNQADFEYCRQRLYRIKAIRAYLDESKRRRDDLAKVFVQMGKENGGVDPSNPDEPRSPDGSLSPPARRAQARRAQGGGSDPPRRGGGSGPVPPSAEKVIRRQGVRSKKRRSQGKSRRWSFKESSRNLNKWLPDEMRDFGWRVKTDPGRRRPFGIELQFPKMTNRFSRAFSTADSDDSEEFGPGLRTERRGTAKATASPQWTQRGGGHAAMADKFESRAHSKSASDVAMPPLPPIAETKDGGGGGGGGDAAEDAATSSSSSSSRLPKVPSDSSMDGPTRPIAPSNTDSNDVNFADDEHVHIPKHSGKSVRMRIEPPKSQRLAPKSPFTQLSEDAKEEEEDEEEEEEEEEEETCGRKAAYLSCRFFEGLLFLFQILFLWLLPFITCIMYRYLCCFRCVTRLVKLDDEHAAMELEEEEMSGQMFHQHRGSDSVRPELVHAGCCFTLMVREKKSKRVPKKVRPIQMPCAVTNCCCCFYLFRACCCNGCRPPTHEMMEELKDYMNKMEKTMMASMSDQVSGTGKAFITFDEPSHAGEFVTRFHDIKKAANPAQQKALGLKYWKARPAPEIMDVDWAYMSQPTNIRYMYQGLTLVILYTLLLTITTPNQLFIILNSIGQNSESDQGSKMACAVLDSAYYAFSCTIDAIFIMFGQNRADYEGSTSGSSLTVWFPILIQLGINWVLLYVIYISARHFEPTLTYTFAEKSLLKKSYQFLFFNSCFLPLAGAYSISQFTSGLLDIDSCLSSINGLVIPGGTDGTQSLKPDASGDITLQVCGANAFGNYTCENVTRPYAALALSCQATSFGSFFENGSLATFTLYLFSRAFITNAVYLLRFSEKCYWGAYRACCAVTDRELKDSFRNHPFERGQSIAILLEVFTICIIFSTMCPLIIPGGLVFFFIKFYIDRYNLCYVWTHRIRSSYKVHQLAYELIRYWALTWYQVFMIAYVAFKGTALMTIMCVVCFVLTWLAGTLMRSYVDEMPIVQREFVRRGAPNSPTGKGLKKTIQFMRDTDAPDSLGRSMRNFVRRKSADLQKSWHRKSMPHDGVSSKRYVRDATGKLVEATTAATVRLAEVPEVDGTGHGHIGEEEGRRMGRNKKLTRDGDLVDAAVSKLDDEEEMQQKEGAKVEMSDIYAASRQHPVPAPRSLPTPQKSPMIRHFKSDSWRNRASSDPKDPIEDRRGSGTFSGTCCPCFGGKFRCHRLSRPRPLKALRRAHLANVARTKKWCGSTLDLVDMDHLTQELVDADEVLRPEAAVRFFDPMLQELKEDLIANEFGVERSPEFQAIIAKWQGHGKVRRDTMAHRMRAHTKHRVEYMKAKQLLSRSGSLRHMESMEKEAAAEARLGGDKAKESKMERVRFAQTERRFKNPRSSASAEEICLSDIPAGAPGDINDAGITSADVTDSPPPAERNV